MFVARIIYVTSIIHEYLCASLWSMRWYAYEVWRLASHTHCTIEKQNHPLVFVMKTRTSDNARSVNNAIKTTTSKSRKHVRYTRWTHAQWRTNSISINRRKSYHHSIGILSCFFFFMHFKWFSMCAHRHPLIFDASTIQIPDTTFWHHQSTIIKSYNERNFSFRREHLESWLLTMTLN